MTDIRFRLLHGKVFMKFKETPLTRRLAASASPTRGEAISRLFEYKKESPFS
jgi:hypothetical protein